MVCHKNHKKQKKTKPPSTLDKNYTLGVAPSQ